MPSVKPNSEDIRRICYKRNLYKERENIFIDIYNKCNSAMHGKHITKENAYKLFIYLESNTFIRTLFPNNLLYEVLCALCRNGIWNRQNEELLSSFVYTLYLRDNLEDSINIKINSSPTIGNDSEEIISILEEHTSYVSPPCYDKTKIDSILKELTLKVDFERFLLDPFPKGLNLKDNLIGFTGKFEKYSRRQCFALVKEYGGIASSASYYMDILFVADMSIAGRFISNQLDAAIQRRRLYGNPLILSEKDWCRLIEVQKIN